MVIVKIELWPRGDEKKSKLLGVCAISNDGTILGRGFGNYDVVLSHAGKYIGKNVEGGAPWKTGKVENHNKTSSPYHLVYKAIKACLWPKRS